MVTLVYRLVPKHMFILRKTHVLSLYESFGVSCGKSAVDSHDNDIDRWQLWVDSKNRMTICILEGGYFHLLISTLSLRLLSFTQVFSVWIK